MKKRLLFGIIIINSTLFFGQSVSKTIQLLPDTGQTTSYTSTFGEDNDYLINTPSYTNNGDGTITDNVTGLMWQKVDGGSMSYASASSYCDNLTLANYTDWRLPTPLESFSILIHQNNNPAINTAFFSSSSSLVAQYWWTNTTQLGDNSKVWCTNSGGGIGNKPKSEAIGEVGGTFRYNVRAVRNSTTPTTLPNHFTDNSDGTITDNLTQLIWQKVTNPSALTWEQALAYAEGLSLGASSEWRLPNIKELQSLNDETLTNPSVNTDYFSSIGVKNYWSSTSLPNQTTEAWYCNTKFGITTYDLKANSNYVICVRGNPTLAVNQETLQSLIKLYPNPASDYLLISFPNDILYAKIELADPLGKVIINKQIKINASEYRFDTDGISDGIYYLSIINGNNKNTYKIIKKK